MTYVLSATVPVYDRWGVQVLCADCLDAMRAMPDCSVHAIVTDPPYGLSNIAPTVVASTVAAWVMGDRERAPDGHGFCGKMWDAFVPPPAVWDEALRVLKPGGWLLCFAGTRMADLMSLSIRLAGFEMRDEIDHVGSRISWMYANGMPKGINVSKAIDREAGAEDKDARHLGFSVFGPGTPKCLECGKSKGGRRSTNCHCRCRDGQSMPVTDAAREWVGWNTTLSPAHEPIIVARKPLAGTVAANVQAHGCGALNIDATRVAGAVPQVTQGVTRAAATGEAIYGSGRDMRTEVMQSTPHDLGRWPSNVIFSHVPLLDASGEVVGDACSAGCVDGCPVAELDRQSGVLTSGRVDCSKIKAKNKIYNTIPDRGSKVYEASTGGASRFFPCFRFEAKAPTSQRPRVNGKAHSTVKPTPLLRFLVRLVTPPDGTVLDMFAGTGTTGQAARAEGFTSILIENDPESIPLIIARLDAHPKTEATPVPVPMQYDLFEPGGLFSATGGAT